MPHFICCMFRMYKSLENWCTRFFLASEIKLLRKQICPFLFPSWSSQSTSYMTICSYCCPLVYCKKYHDLSPSQTRFNSEVICNNIKEPNQYYLLAISSPYLIYIISSTITLPNEHLYNAAYYWKFISGYKKQHHV